MVETDSISSMTLIKHRSGAYMRFSIYPSRDLKKMNTGTVALDETEMKRLHDALHAYFENLDLPSYVQLKDITGLKRKETENTRFERDRAALPVEDAQDLQSQNLEDVAIIDKKKKEGETGGEE